MPSLVSTAEVIARIPAAGNLASDDLQLLIDANEILLRNRVTVRADADVELRFTGTYGKNVILLPARFASIDTVTEHWLFADPTSDITLAEDDWLLGPDGTAIERLEGGTNPSGGFSDEVIVAGTLLDQTALLKNILIQLCAIDVNGTANAGLKRQRLGDYEEEKNDSAQSGVAQQKENILSQLATPLPLFS